RRVVGHHLPDAALPLAGLVDLPPGRHLAHVVLLELEAAGLVVGGGRQGRAEQGDAHHVEPAHHRLSLNKGEQGNFRLTPPVRDVSHARPSGRVTVHVVPSPGALAISICPPWAATRLWAMLSPSPVPPWARLRALSTR